MSATPRYAARLNGFAAPGGPNGPLDLAARAAAVPGLNAVDLNYPDHLALDPVTTSRRLADLGLAVNGLAMRYYSDPGFRRGAFAHPDPAVRRKAIDLTRAGVDAALATGSDLLTIWLGQDGWDYAFQADHARMWDAVVAGLAEVAGHDPACRISVEYKPDEPRAKALLPDCATTILAISAAGAPNLGVTLDFAHALYAGENPARAAMLAHRFAALHGVHLNDGYGARDDGLMVASVHPRETLELLVELRRIGYGGALYFDTFPDASGLDPAAECAANIATVERLGRAADRLVADNALAAARAAQDAVAAQAIVDAALYR